MQVPSLGWEDPLEEGMATHSRILAWRIPWATVPRITKSQEALNRLSMYARMQPTLQRRGWEGIQGLGSTSCVQTEIWEEEASCFGVV